MTPVIDLGYLIDLLLTRTLIAREVAEAVVILSSRRRHAQLGLAAAFVVLSASVATLLVVPAHSKPVAVADVGTLAPDFQLEDLTGTQVTLSSFRGQAVVLYFCSGESQLSKAYDDRVERLAHDYTGDARVQFFAIDVAPNGTIDPLSLRLDSSVAARPFPTLLDNRGIVATRYSAVSARTPTVVVINPRGEVRYRGPFDNNPDLAFATRHLCDEALRDVLESSTTAVATMHR